MLTNKVPWTGIATHEEVPFGLSGIDNELRRFATNAMLSVTSNPCRISPDSLSVMATDLGRGARVGSTVVIGAFTKPCVAIDRRPSIRIDEVLTLTIAVCAVASFALSRPAHRVALKLTVHR
jgi:hypothetical protein